MKNLIFSNILLVFCLCQNAWSQTVKFQIEKANETLFSLKKTSDEKKVAIDLLNQLTVLYPNDSICKAIGGLLYAHITNTSTKFQVDKQPSFKSIMDCNSCAVEFLSSIKNLLTKSEIYSNESKMQEINLKIWQYFYNESGNAYKDNRSIQFLDSIKFLESRLDFDSITYINRGSVYPFRRIPNEHVKNMNSSVIEKFERAIERGQFYLPYVERPYASEYAFEYNRDLIFLIAKHLDDEMNFSKINPIKMGICVALRGYYGATSLTKSDKDSLEKILLPKCQNILNCGNEGLLSYSMMILSSFQINKNDAKLMLERVRDTKSGRPKADAIMFLEILQRP